MLEKSKNMVNQTQFFRAAVNKIKIATSKPDSHQKKKKVVEEEGGSEGDGLSGNEKKAKVKWCSN